jgi:hypothetical protein
MDENNFKSHSSREQFLEEQLCALTMDRKGAIACTSITMKWSRKCALGLVNSIAFNIDDFAQKLKFDFRVDHPRD